MRQPQRGCGLGSALYRRNPVGVDRARVPFLSRFHGVRGPCPASFVIALALLLLAGGAEMAQAQTVSVWLTTDNQVKKLQQQVSVAFAAGSGGSNPVYVDETQTYQQVEGFGAAFTDSAAYLLNEVATPAARTNAMNSLFTRNAGIGVSFVRIPMGASDLARWDYSYDDQPPGQTDTNLTSFSIASIDPSPPAPS